MMKDFVIRKVFKGAQNRYALRLRFLVAASNSMLDTPEGCGIVQMPTSSPFGINGGEQYMEWDTDQEESQSSNSLLNLACCTCNYIKKSKRDRPLICKVYVL